MSNSRVRKASKGRAVHMSEGDSFRSRKEENYRLHDEADLVNFRADALNRYITNQDLLDNVTSKIIHTSRFLPPPMFPQQVLKRGYSEKSTDSELMDYVKGMKIGEMFSGDIRLMNAKLKVSAQELAEAETELEGLASLEVLNDESRFQKVAVEALSQAQAKCTDVDSLNELEAQLHSTIKQYSQRFSKQYVLDTREVKKHAISVQTLAPEVKVKSAPADYDPRSVPPLGSVVSSTKLPESAPGSVGANPEVTQGTETHQQPQSIHVQVNSNEPMDESRYTGANEYIDDEISDNFGAIDQQHGHVHASPSADNAVFDPSLGNSAELPESESDAYISRGQPTPHENLPVHAPHTAQSANSIHSTHSNQPEPMDSMENDVDMDELDQFLADPQDDMDGMDALMDFDQGNDNSEPVDFGQSNEQSASAMDDDPFSVDFLSQMGGDME